MSVRRVVVVGAGIVGTSLASALARRGVDVTLVDPAPASGTSASSYAWINSHKKHPLDYHALNVAGVAAWRRLAATQPDVVDFAGHVEIAESASHRASLRARVDRLRSLGCSARWSSPAEARERTSLPVADDALVASFDDEGHAFPLRRMAQLRRELADAGVPIQTTSVERIASDGDRASALLVDGDRLEADDVVVCAGNASERLVASAGGALPLVEPVVDSAAFGYLVDVRAPGHGIRGIVTTDDASMRPGDDGRLLVQVLDLDGTAEPGVAPPPGMAREVARRLARLLPGVDPVVEAIRVGHRVIPADGRTAAGRIAPGSPVWCVVTHSGIVLAPWLAEAIASELTGGEPEPLLAAFRPDRFLDGSGPDARPDAPRAPGDQ